MTDINRNSGGRNSGDRNSGDRNSGDRNSGDRNSGDCNSGDCNSGYYNSGNRNSGIFNTDEPFMRAFNKPTALKFSDLNTSTWPKFISHVTTTKWITLKEMTDKEKESHPEHKTTNGYLKVYSYKEAWRNAWDNAELQDRKKVFNLPNFDNDIFLEITGINVGKELNMETRLDKDAIIKKIAELQKLLGV